jgi:hypothetical protein
LLSVLLGNVELSQMLPVILSAPMIGLAAMPVFACGGFLIEAAIQFFRAVPKKSLDRIHRTLGVTETAMAPGLPDPDLSQQGRLVKLQQQIPTEPCTDLKPANPDDAIATVPVEKSTLRKRG